MVRLKAKRGFTLTELAIILSIVGLLTSALWVWAAATRENFQVTTAMQQLVKSVDNIRDTMAAVQDLSLSPLSYANDTDITQTLDTRSVFPYEMHRDPKATLGTVALDHAMHGTSGGTAPTWGSFHILAEGRSFRAEFQGLTESQCVKFLMALPLNDNLVNVSRVQVNVATNACTITNGVAATTPAICATGVTPMLITTANAWCDVAGTGNEIDVDFKLH